MERAYRIWSIEHGAWWKWSHMGYTKSKEEAGIYSESEALQIVRDANIMNRDLPNEAMVEASDLQHFLESKK